MLTKIYQIVSSDIFCFPAYVDFFERKPHSSLSQVHYACVRLQLSSCQKLTHQIRLQTNIISLSISPSILIPALCLRSQVSVVLIELSGASSGEDVEVAKVCSLIGVLRTHAEMCVWLQSLKWISNNPVSVTHTASPIYLQTYHFCSGYTQHCLTNRRKMHGENLELQFATRNLEFVCQIVWSLIRNILERGFQS